MVTATWPNVSTVEASGKAAHLCQIPYAVIFHVLVGTRESEIVGTQYTVTQTLVIKRVSNSSCLVTTLLLLNGASHLTFNTGKRVIMNTAHSLPQGTQMVV